MLTNRGTCTIRTEPLAEPIGELRWLASCGVCGREYHTATEDPSQHWPPHLPIYLPPGKIRKTLVVRQTQAQRPLSFDCPHRGLVVRSAQVECCGGQIRRPKIYACGLHLAPDGMSGECSIERVDGVRNCEACIRAGANKKE